MRVKVDYTKTDLPCGSSGEWSIRRVLLPPRASANDARPECFHYRPGAYTELRKGGITYMTDLFDEWWTQRPAIDRARQLGGRVLITGLGLGLVVHEILRDPQSRAVIDEVVILENSADVIGLVAPSLRAEFGELVRVVEADAFAWKAMHPEQFNIVWHDIWPDPAAVQVAEDIDRLRRHHAPWSTWQGFWPEVYQQALAGSSPG